MSLSPVTLAINVNHSHLGIFYWNVFKHYISRFSYGPVSPFISYAVYIVFKRLLTNILTIHTFKLHKYYKDGSFHLFYIPSSLTHSMSHSYQVTLKTLLLTQSLSSVCIFRFHLLSHRQLQHVIWDVTFHGVFIEPSNFISLIVPCYWLWPWKFEELPLFDFLFQKPMVTFLRRKIAKERCFDKAVSFIYYEHCFITSLTFHSTL